MENAHTKNETTILTAGVPCQPASQAGKQRGKEDDRWLWPQTFRVIQETNPTWCILENVRGILTLERGMVFQELLSSLENLGYEVAPFIIPAVAKNAPHRRDRVWFVAYRNNAGGGASERGAISHGKTNSEERQHTLGRIDGPDSDAQNPIGERGRRRDENGGQVLECQSPEIEDARPSWETNWLEVATQFCSVDDGLPVALDGFELSKSKNRAEQLKAYGNSIVPQVAIEIMKAIKAVA